MKTTNNYKCHTEFLDYRSREAYERICALTLSRKDHMLLRRTKRERASALDSTIVMTAELGRKLKAVSDRLLEALVKYESYIAKALTAYTNSYPSPQSIEITFWISGDKDHRHLTYPQWYYQPEYKPNRQQRLQLQQLEKEIKAEPNWVDVNDALYNEVYRSGDFEDDIEDEREHLCNYNSWLKLRWSSNSRQSIMDIISRRSSLLEQLSCKDEDGICLAFYRLKDIYSLALEDMLDIREYKVDLQAKIINF